MLVEEWTAKRAIVIGATSGIGRALAINLSRQGYSVGVAGRRQAMLETLVRELHENSCYEVIDVTDTASLLRGLGALVERLEGLDLLVISAGIGHINPDLDWDLERDTIAVNVAGFAAAANFGMRHFVKQRSGHLVGISSVAAIRGGGATPAYNASKAFASNYLEGLRQNAAHKKMSITITDVKPGFVNTSMAKGNGLFWVASVDKAAEQICRAIRSRKSHVYVTRRWRLVGWLLKILPSAIYARI